MLRRIARFLKQHPAIVEFVLLAVAMVAILLWAARDVNLLPTQLATMVVATVVLAGLCVWILHWE